MKTGQRSRLKYLSWGNSAQERLWLFPFAAVSLGYFFKGGYTVYHLVKKHKYKLEIQNAHEIIFEYCKPELLAENYFLSVFEAIKSIADRIRKMTGAIC